MISSPPPRRCLTRSKALRCTKCIRGLPVQAKCLAITTLAKAILGEFSGGVWNQRQWRLYYLRLLVPDNVKLFLCLNFLELISNLALCPERPACFSRSAEIIFYKACCHRPVTLQVTHIGSYQRRIIMQKVRWLSAWRYEALSLMVWCHTVIAFMPH